MHHQVGYNGATPPPLKPEISPGAVAKSFSFIVNFRVKRSNIDSGTPNGRSINTEAENTSGQGETSQKHLAKLRFYPLLDSAPNVCAKSSSCCTSAAPQ